MKAFFVNMQRSDIDICVIKWVIMKIWNCFHQAGNKVFQYLLSHTYKEGYVYNKIKLKYFFSSIFTPDMCSLQRNDHAIRNCERFETGKTTVHMVTLQLLLNRECQTTNIYLGLIQRRNSRDLLATACLTTCTYTQSRNS